MTRMEKWRNKRDLIEQMNKNMTIFNHLQMAYELPSYKPKHARRYLCI